MTVENTILETGMEIKIPSLLSFTESLSDWRVLFGKQKPFHNWYTEWFAPCLGLHSTLHPQATQLWWFVVESYFRIEGCCLHQLQKRWHKKGLDLIIITDQEIRHISLEFEDMIASHESITLPAVVARTIFKLLEIKWSLNFKVQKVANVFN